MKRLEFVGSSLEDMKEFPAEARRAAGFELGFVQRGLDPSDWKPMKDVGGGVREIRIHVLGEWRVLYVARLAEAIYVRMRFRRRHRRPKEKTSSWLGHVTDRSETDHEKENDQVQRQCFC